MEILHCTKLDTYTASVTLSVSLDKLDSLGVDSTEGLNVVNGYVELKLMSMASTPRKAMLDLQSQICDYV